MKKSLSVLLAACLIFGVCHCMAFAQQEADDNQSWGDLGNGVYWRYDGPSNTLIISGSGPMPDVELEWDRDYNEYRLINIDKIEIGKGITHIGDFAFTNFYHEQFRRRFSGEENYAAVGPGTWVKPFGDINGAK